MPEPAGIWFAQAREMCPESDEHHDRVWFCMTCRALAYRLQPVHEALADVLADADLSLTVDWNPQHGLR